MKKVLKIKKVNQKRKAFIFLILLVISLISFAVFVSLTITKGDYYPVFAFASFISVMLFLRPTVDNWPDKKDK
jgi:hypothetical protein